MVPKNHRAAGSPSLPSMQSKTYYRSRACVPTFTPESEHRKQLEANIRKKLATYVIFRYSRPLIDILATVLTLEWCLEWCLKKGQGIERSLRGVGGRKGALGKEHQGKTGRGTRDGVCVGNDRIILISIAPEIPDIQYHISFQVQPLLCFLAVGVHKLTSNAQTAFSPILGDLPKIKASVTQYAFELFGTSCKICTALCVRDTKSKADLQ